MSVFEVGKTISESTGGHASAGGNSGAGNRFYFSDDAYRYLSKWLQLGSHAWESSLNDLLKDIKSIHPDLIGFLKIEGIETIWRKIQNNAPSKLHFKKQFHRWFDGLKTMRLLKYFSENHKS